MKPLYKILLIFSLIPFWSACSDDDSSGNNTESILLQGVSVQIADKNTDISVTTRAVSDYVVNKENDPTSNKTSDNARLAGQGPWKLDVVIYGNNGSSYLPSTVTWSYLSENWVPSVSIFLPSYFSPRVEATLYSQTKTSDVEPDQSTAEKLLLQDILVEQSNSYTVLPAHVLPIRLRHKHSMLDFILKDIYFDDISSVTVLANGVTYTPFKVNTTHVEYLVILPETIANPQIIVKTEAGATYTKTVNIASTQRNNCYCITLTGVELALSSVSVVDWAYGTALAGQYTTPASYPTFRGISNESVTLVYDNGLSQVITFNERGEATVKPYGRTIIKVGDRDLSAAPIILSQMYVDLRDYLT